MNKIRELREKQNIDQKVLAIDMGVSQPTVSDWESGKKMPSSKNMARLADYFGVSIDYLSGRGVPGEDGEMAEILQEMKDRPDLQTLFSISRKAAPADVRRAAKFLDALAEEPEDSE